MIKCINCNSHKVIFKFDEIKYMVINECFNCYNIIHLFIDDYINNYKSFLNINKKENFDIKDINFCLKHNKPYISFCFNCQINLCDECLLSHNRAVHLIQKIEEIIPKNEIENIEKYRKNIIILKEDINKKIETIKTKKSEENFCQLLNSLLNIIKIKEIFLSININDKNVNSYDLISLKYILNKFNQQKLGILINNIKNVSSYPEKDKDINNYKKCIFYSINSIPNNKIINSNFRQWVNHVIQLQNGNIVSAHWEYLLLHKINKEKNKLETILRINIHNGCINHIFEYKKNKILACDNKMKIIQLSQDNQNYKCLNVLDYGRKIIPFIPNNQAYKGNKKFLFIATPNGIKVYSYPDDDNTENDKNLNINNSSVGEVQNEIKFLGAFSTEYDYSAIIQVNNKICGIFKIKNSNNNHFACWEINYDFNDDSKFDINQFKLLGRIKNVNSAIGRYSLSQLNNDYIIIGTMKDSFHSSFPNQKSGISVVSLNPVEIIQYIKNDEITSIASLNNNIILTGGKNLEKNIYYIRQWKYEEEKKELLYIGYKKMHTDYINTILEIKDGFFISCGRDGNIYIMYYD